MLEHRPFWPSKKITLKYKGLKGSFHSKQCRGIIWGSPNMLLNSF